MHNCLGSISWPCLTQKSQFTTQIFVVSTDFCGKQGHKSRLWWQCPSVMSLLHGLSLVSFCIILCANIECKRHWIYCWHWLFKSKCYKAGTTLRWLWGNQKCYSDIVSLVLCHHCHCDFVIMRWESDMSFRLNFPLKKKSSHKSEKEKGGNYLILIKEEYPWLL